MSVVSSQLSVKTRHNRHAKVKNSFRSISST
jgi:hypothetical protein